MCMCACSCIVLSGGGEGEREGGVRRRWTNEGLGVHIILAAEVCRRT